MVDMLLAEELFHSYNFMEKVLMLENMPKPSMLPVCQIIVNMHIGALCIARKMLVSLKRMMSENVTSEC